PKPPVARTEPAGPRPTVVAANVPTRLPGARAAQAQDSEGDGAESDNEPTLRVSAIQKVVPPRAAAAAPMPPLPIAERQAETDDTSAAAPKKDAPAAAQLGR